MFQALTKTGRVTVGEGRLVGFHYSTVDRAISGLKKVFAGSGIEILTRQINGKRTYLTEKALEKLKPKVRPAEFMKFVPITQTKESVVFRAEPLDIEAVADFVKHFKSTNEGFKLRPTEFHDEYKKWITPLGKPLLSLIEFGRTVTPRLQELGLKRVAIKGSAFIKAA